MGDSVLLLILNLAIQEPKKLVAHFVNPFYIIFSSKS